MFHARSPSRRDAGPRAKRARNQPDDLSADDLVNEVAGQSSDHLNESLIYPITVLISLLTYPFLLPLVVDCLCDRNVVARLLMINKLIRVMTPKYAFERMLPTGKALRVIRSSRDITFSVTRVNKWFYEDIQDLIQVHQENSIPLQEARCHLHSLEAFAPAFVIPRFVTHLICVNIHMSTRTPVSIGSIPNGVVELNLQHCSLAVGCIPPSVKRLSLTLDLGDFDPAVIPSTVTDLSLTQSDWRHHGLQPIHRRFPSSLRNLLLGSYNLPIPPGVIPSSLSKLDCHSNLLCKLEAGAIPDSVKEMKIEWNMHDVPIAGVLPDSVTRIAITSSSANQQVVPHWRMPASLTSWEMSMYGHMRITAGVVPDTVTHFRCSCQVETGALPNSITHLEMIMCNSEYAIGLIPPSVTHLSLIKSSSLPAMFTPGIIPSSVTHLAFSCDEKQKMVPGIIPDSVTHLTFHQWFNRPLPGGAIPQMVTHLVLGDKFNRSLTRRSLPRALTHRIRH